jgi:hypothetical protein
MYPELSVRALYIRSNGKTAARDISVFEVIPTGMVEPHLQPLLSAHVAFSSTHNLQQFVGSGPMLRDADNAALASSIQSAVAHGLDVNAEIARHALGFGPDKGSALLARINQMHLDVAIGAPTVLTTVPSVQTNNSRYGFLWVVNLLGVRPADIPRHYAAQFEPFVGQLVSLTEQ